MAFASRRPVALSEASRGKRLLFLVAGPRGEVQPFIALVAGCKKAGFEVLTATQNCHQGFFEDFGVPVVDCDVLGEPHAAGASLPSAPGGDGGELGPGALRTMLEYATDFRPDLILCGRPCSAAAHAFAWRLGVPVMECSVEFLFPTGERQSPREEFAGCFAFWHYMSWIRCRRDIFRKYERSQVAILRALVKSGSDSDDGSWSCLQAYLLDTVQALATGPIAVSPSVLSLPQDAPPGLAQPVGYLVVSRQDQLTKADDYFGCRSVLRAFVDLDPNDPPIYIGFGPCVDGGPQHLAELAAGSAMRAGRRAVVLCGSVGLGPASLASSAEDLQAYAGRSIVFVGSAPHEWLFPRCRVVVHHGGAGTVACALRAGVPQIIVASTPEQRLQADLVTRLGAGIHMGMLAACSPERLASAVEQVAADGAMLTRCKELGERLQKEDGVKASIEHLDRFFKEQVATGDWAAADRLRRREHIALRSGVVDGCFTWLGRIVCGRARNDFAPRLSAEKV